ncbi:FAD-dependent oxidoreductase [Sphingobium sp. HBC34]|uniref:FAD-dependent oxidoreductase n=1 Tax=Sphingobium cyanobacteriorum TaxID=3063954 RepID=A0ABT8ZMG7_9SPHN|nr:FAD-dependent oxidoreductase [Sphingobium sp. HBC34]MDO7835593.1 FAD-dependent oxidoreductase [Sphingobium sp. HBC34]
MKSHVRVAVIGGGVVGCSILYHLTKLGWSDVALIERKELTSGSSWHAAGGFHALNSDPGIAKLQSYTIELYREIEALSEHSVGIHMTGGINIAATDARWEFLRADHARHRVLGLETHLLTPSEIRDICPLIDVTDVRGALFDSHEGHVDPSGATYAYAKAAKKAGADIYRHTRVMDLKPTGRGTWRVITDQGEIEAEHVVNAAGLWAREMGAMVGVQLPLIPMEHHYLITEDIPEIVAAARELPLILDLDAEIYMRQERGGMLVGVYEKDAKPWAVNGTPWDYGETELLPPQLDRLADALIKGYERFPAVAEAGIRRIINGPFTFSPDGNPLIGPVPGVPNYWSACGVMAGFAQGGGVGLSIAQWIIDGEPSEDIFAMDVARFGPYATPGYTTEKAREFYANRFLLAYPNEYWPAGRDMQHDALFDSLKARNAVFGVSYGLEIPLYFAAEGEEAVETPSLRRSNAFPNVAREVKAVQEGVGILDASSFAKYEVSGPNAAAALDRLIANRLPGTGRIRLAPLLAPSGRLMGDLTVMRLAEDRFFLFGSGYLQAWHGRWFDTHLKAEGVTIRNRTQEYQGIHLAGPNARTLLERLTSCDVSDKALPFMGVREMEVGLAPAMVARLSLTGELTYEIYMPAQCLRAAYLKAIALGQDLGVVDFGFHALASMRLEKSYGIWSREFSRDYTPGMAGLGRFIDFSKDFIGKDAALAERDTPADRTLVTLAVEATDADASGYEPVWHDGNYVGFVTSGGYGHRVGTSIVMAYIDRAVADAPNGFAVSILGEKRPAQIAREALYDPASVRPRS